MRKNILLVLLIVFFGLSFSNGQEQSIKLNDKEYFEKTGLNIMVFQDIYPEGHQGGLGIIQNGVRVATNGDIRLEPTPGQWAPIPIQHSRIVDKANNEIRVTLSFPLTYGKGKEKAVSFFSNVKTDKTHLTQIYKFH